MNTALPIATTPFNIKSGCRVSGIRPLVLDIFQNHYFSPPFVTDHPVPESLVMNCFNDHSINSFVFNTIILSMPTHSPEEIIPFLRARLYKQLKREEMKTIAAIFTDTPTRNSIVSARANRKRKRGEIQNHQNEPRLPKKPEKSEQASDFSSIVSQELSSEDISYTESEASLGHLNDSDEKSFFILNDAPNSVNIRIRPN